jgi:hypothetical protein
MLQKMHELNGDAIVAQDGEIGSIKDVYLDDEWWAVRSLVVDTGKWGNSPISERVKISNVPARPDSSRQIFND